MNTQTRTQSQVSEKAQEVLALDLPVSKWGEEVVALGRRHHQIYRIISHFQGVIDLPVIDPQGEWVHIPLRKDDEVIIPTEALRRHAAVEQAGYRIVQVIIGHELRAAPETLTAMPAPSPKPRPGSEIDWGRAADVAARGFLVGLAGIVMISAYAFVGALQVIDPSYCVVLDDEVGTVVELLSWNSEA